LVGSHFDRKVADRDIRDYRRNGPHKSTTKMVQALIAAGVSGATVLDVGAGIGAVSHELLARGAASATLLDASPAYEEAARSEAERRGHAERLEIRHGDAVELASQLPSADIVALDRVICCYPDMEKLVAATAQRAGRLYGAVYPRDSWWVRLMFAFENGVQRLQRSDFRAYMHSPGTIDAAVRRQGLRLRAFHRGPVWISAVYERGPATTAS
jgi:magnesium-protoporphyrin O-methyltransferase